MVSREIKQAMDSVSPADRWMHAYTYSGHPTCCAVALKNIDIMERERLWENAAKMGDRLYAGLKSAFGDSPYAGDIRGGKATDEALELFHAAPGGVRTVEPFSTTNRWASLDTDAANGCIRDAAHANTADEIQTARGTVQDGIPRPDEARERLRRDINTAGDDAARRTGARRYLRVHHIAEEAVAIVTRFSDRHGREIEFVKNVAEA